MIASGLAVGPVHLDYLDPPAAQEAGQAHSIGAGAFHADLGHLTEPLEPAQQGLVASSIGRKGLGSDQSAQWIECGSDVGIEVSVDATGDAGRGFYNCHGHPFFLNR